MIMTRDRVCELLPILQAYTEGKEIQYYSEYYGTWIDLAEVYLLDDTEYRIKPTEKADCTKGNNLYKAEERPFENIAELIAHYDRTANNSRPANTMPLIWVRDKECKSENLIIAYNENCVFIQDVWFTLSELFDKYEFLDGTPCGVEE